MVYRVNHHKKGDRRRPHVSDGRSVVRTRDLPGCNAQDGLVVLLVRYCTIGGNSQSGQYVLCSHDRFGVLPAPYLLHRISILETRDSSWRPSTGYDFSNSQEQRESGSGALSWMSCSWTSRTCISAPQESRIRYPTPGSVSKRRGRAGSGSTFRRSVAMNTRR
jgi:hypothetical protein